MLEHCLSNYFQFGDCCYHQVKGTPKCSPISAFIAKAVLQRREKSVFARIIPKVWRRYVDIIFVVIEKDNWRGLWTWPPWVICAPAFNHKLKKFCIYREFSYIFFLMKLHKRTEEIRIGQCKGFYMEHWGSGTPQPANKFKMAERRMKFQETQ